LPVSQKANGLTAESGDDHWPFFFSFVRYLAWWFVGLLFLEFLSQTGWFS
jgi:hypothetical protein